MPNTISFPGLNWTFTIDPVAFQIGGWKVHWYGILIAVGFALAVLYGLRLCKKTGEIKVDDVLDMLIVIAPIAVIGTRLYFCAFHFDYYAQHPIEILYIWDGGLAIYGGVITAVICALIGCRIKKVSVLSALDLTAMGFLIGQIIGRWGNFVNAECFGRDIAAAADGSYPFYAMQVSTHPQSAVHPLFLYESLLNLVLFLILHFRFPHRKFKGETFFCYMAGYGAIRFFTEGIRGDDALLLWNTDLRVSQVLAAIFCVTALVLILVFRIRRRKQLNDAAADAMIREITAPAEPETAAAEAPAGEAGSPDGEAPKKTEPEPPAETPAEPQTGEGEEN